MTSKLLLSIVAGLLPLTAHAQSLGTFAATGNPIAPRVGHTATLLNDGRVLIAGGGIGYSASTSVELYDPVAGTFSPTGSMTVRRVAHTATLLADGRVLITGGEDNGTLLSSAEVYDPATGRFTATGKMRSARSRHAATLLGSGKVSISGTDWNWEMYDPASGVFTPSFYVNASAVPATRLLNGNIFLGGFDGADDAALYDPIAGTVRGLPFPGPLYLDSHTATLLPSGKVLLAGGSYGGWAAWGYWGASLFDPVSETFRATGPLLTPRGNHTATLLASGSVLITGGYDGSHDKDYASAELYNPGLEAFSYTGSMIAARTLHTATLLRDGRVLIVGGELFSGSGGGPESTAELYLPPSDKTPACGNYATVNGSCRRIAVLPWYAAMPGQWETDLEFSAGTSDTVTFTYESSLSMLPYWDGIAHNLLLEDPRGRFVAEGVDVQLKSGDSYAARILAEADCTECPPRASLGSLGITIDGPNAAALDNAHIRATYILLAGGQADAPVIFRDQASSLWKADVTEQAGSIVTSFAVVNLGPAPQAVIVKVFDAGGNLTASAKTPVLYGATTMGTPFQDADGLGAVYAAALSSLLGVDLAQGGAVFNGTVTFEGELGGKIAPLVVRMNSGTIASVPVTPQ